MSTKYEDYKNMVLKKLNSLVRCAKICTANTVSSVFASCNVKARIVAVIFTNRLNKKWVDNIITSAHLTLLNEWFEKNIMKIYYPNIGTIRKLLINTFCPC